MRVSIGVTNYSWPNGPQRLGAELTRLVRAGDQAGVDTVWVVDDLLQADPNATVDQRDMLEASTTLGLLAARAERVRLGTMVSPTALRPPTRLVKTVTTLDVLSGRRAWLGIGAGYHHEEAQAIGLPLAPVAERFERLEETLQLAIQMWAGDQAPFQGRHYRLGRPAGRPLPTQRPHPPILIGGAGDRWRHTRRRIPDRLSSAGPVTFRRFGSSFRLRRSTRRRDRQATERRRRQRRETTVAVQVSAIMLGVEDLARAKRFYGDGLGCTLHRPVQQRGGRGHG